jgi:penicillin-binding protein 1C
LNNNLGIKSINKDESYYGLSLILGGAEVSLWEVAGCYASMARLLLNYIPQQSKYNMYDVHSPQVFSNKSKVKLLDEKQFLSAGSIYKTFEALSELQRPDEEGAWKSFSTSSKIAWKTGTSFGHKDAWSIGITPNYVIGVWIGNADGEGRASLMGVTKAAPIMFDLFNRLPKSNWFDKPYDDLKPISICRHSGFVSNDHCIYKDTIYSPITLKESLPCLYHKVVFLSANKSNQVREECCNCEPIKEFAFELPPVNAYYYKMFHPEYLDVPPYSKECMYIGNEQKLEVVYPPKNAKIFLPKNFIGSTEKFVVQATTIQKESKLYWHLDDNYLGVTEDFHHLAIRPDIGKHHLSVVNEDGEKVERNFEIISSEL